MTDFIPGITPIPASFAIITDADKQAMHDQINKGWLTAGPVNAKFEKALSEFTGIKYVRTCNSGSSANLLAVATMVEAGYWKAGDEIITAACAFPTTVNPLLLYGLVPVFVDVDIPTYNVTQQSLVDAISKEKTKGIMLAHTLGNPIPKFISGYFGLPVVEDVCDSLGSAYDRLDPARPNLEPEHVGQRAHIATCSFFPAHHITTGEGGAVFTQDAGLAAIAESIRDWGRACWCIPGDNNTCGTRFESEVDGVLYDHKYQIDKLGFNLKSTDIAAACGLSQIQRLPEFIAQRRSNFHFLSNRLVGISNHIILPEPTPGTSPSWFGFPITIRETGQRQALQEYLWAAKIDTRLLFTGNITRHSYMKGRNFRISGSLENSDKIMADSLWLGVHPHLTEEMLEFVTQKLEAFFK